MLHLCMCAAADMLTQAPQHFSSRACGVSQEGCTLRLAGTSEPDPEPPELCRARLELWAAKLFSLPFCSITQPCWPHAVQQASHRLPGGPQCPAL